VWKGSVASSDIIAGQVVIGSFSFDGRVLTVSAGSKSGFSKILSFTASDKSIAHYRVAITSSLAVINVTPGESIPGTTASFSSNIATAGDNEGNMVIPTATTPATLNQRVKVFVAGFQVLPFSLNAPYMFYVTLMDGSTFVYLIDFKVLTVSVPSLLKFTSLAVLPDGRKPEFQETSVSVLQGTVLNPSGLGELTMLKPYNAKITLQQA